MAIRRKHLTSNCIQARYDTIVPRSIPTTIVVIIVHILPTVFNLDWILFHQSVIVIMM
jgi:hypothetical protein